MRITSGKTQRGDSDLSTPVDIGDGDTVAGYYSIEPTLVNVARGTSASPDKEARATMQVSRTLELSSTQFVGDGADSCAALAGKATGGTNNDAQPIGVLGMAFNESVNPVSTGGDDSCGVYGVGKTVGSGTGVGIGAFFMGQSDSAAGKITATEFRVTNQTGADKSYSPTGFSDATGLWIGAGGTHDAAVGIAFHDIPTQFSVGIGFTAGSVKDVAISDDSSSTTVFDVNGTHTTGIDTSGATISGDAILLAATHKIRFGSSGPLVTSNAGSPEGVVTAPLGSYCADSTNGEGYIKKSGTGNTGWKLVTHA